MKTVSITTAVELTTTQLKKLQKSLEKKLGSVVEFKTSVDPQVGGGLRLVVDAVEYDYTIQGKLSQLEKKILAKLK